MGTRVRIAGALVAGGAVLATGCTQSGTAQSAGRATAPPSAGPSTGPSTGPSAGPSAGLGAPGAGPHTPAPAPRHRTLRPGARGAEVKVLQERLRGLHYDPGAVDGKYGQTTQMALWAFQKVNRLKRTGNVGTRVWTALDAPRAPRPLVKRGADERVEIDLRRQLLYVYKGGETALISHISSGGGYLFCARDPGSDTPRCRYAVTSTGDFRTGRRVGGWDHGTLGDLYKPVYFNGGIAVHGYPSVPLAPASHGCVRVPMHTSVLFQRLVGTGVRVHVRRPG
jgi:peptidoglycan hydrolase-like protein with peptidoglycan-binding domain